MRFKILKLILKLGKFGEIFKLRKDENIMNNSGKIKNIR
jgi:hypothetical protein